MSVSNRVFTVFSFITLILVLIPFPWHLKARNVGTCLYMLWTALGLISCFVNSIIWRDNVTDYASVRVWCDITTRIIVAINVAIPAAALCISHRLYCTVSLRSTNRTDKEKYFDIMVDLSIGGGFPVVCGTVLYYIVQGHRYDIYEEAGCWPVFTNTPAIFIVVLMWPILIGLISATYSVMNFTLFRKRRAQFKETLSAVSSHSANNYLRLMALAAVDIACCIPLAISNIVTDAKICGPWMSWEDMHYDFSFIGQFPISLLRSVPALNQSVQRPRWILIGCGLIFFAFFGFSEEAQIHYKHALSCIAKYVGYTTNSSSEVGVSPGSEKFKRPSHGPSNGVNYQARRPITVGPMRNERYDTERNSNPGSDDTTDEV